MMRRLSITTSCHLFATICALMASPAYAQEAGSENSGDIIVTARRMEERLQDVPISITVFSQQQIADRNIVNAADLASYTPSMGVSQRFGPEKASFSIRGFVQDLATSPSVGVYFADVVAPRSQGGTTSGNQAPVGSFMDLQNVQVLKGPQGTLQGRNTTGGAVLLVPNKPTGRLEGYVEGSVGDYNLWRAQGMINIPLADTFKVRAVVDRQNRDGYMHNQSGIGPRDYNDINYFAARLSILAELTPELENYSIATYSNSDTNGYGARIVVCDRSKLRSNGFTTLTAASQLTSSINAPAACDQLDRQAARGDGPLDVDIDKRDPYLKLKHWQVINTTTWQATDDLRIRNIASYQEYREDASFNLYGDNFRISSNMATIPAAFRVPQPVPGTKYQYVSLSNPLNQNLVAESTFTEELQFQGKTVDDRFDWQFGGYLERARPIGFTSSNSASFLDCISVESRTCVNPLAIGGIQYFQGKTSFNSTAFYAQGTYKITSKLSLTGGIRYTMDKVTALSEITRITVPAGVLTCNDTVRFFTGTPGVPKVVTDPTQCSKTFVTESNKPTWLIDLDFKPSEDALLYAKWARGYRQGGVNITNIGLETWEPEEVDAYEVGAKASFHGAVHGNVTFAAFYNDFRNQQITASGVPAFTGFNGAAVILNAGKSRMWGIEAEGTVIIWDRLRIDAGYSYLDTKIIDIVVPPIPVGSPYSAFIPSANKGDPLAQSPKNRLTLTATYTLPLPESVGAVSLGATFTHTDRQLFSRGTLPQYQFLPATDILNLNVNWNNVAGQPIDLAFFMTNVTDEIYQVGVGGSYTSAGFENLIYAPPRMFGFRVKYRFGD
jgi:iron complex outermembrane receptor protein